MKTQSLPLQIAGEWTGTNRLWLSPDAPPSECATTLQVVPVAGGRFMALSQRWEYDGKPQDGLLVLRCDPEDEKSVAQWVDSFHMSGGFLSLTGTFKDGQVSLLGSYAAPPGPDWGWRIVVDGSKEDRLQILMFNIEPDGHEDRAVESTFTRRK